MGHYIISFWDGSPPIIGAWSAGDFRLCRQEFIRYPAAEEIDYLNYIFVTIIIHR